MFLFFFYNLILFLIACMLSHSKILKNFTLLKVLQEVIVRFMDLLDAIKHFANQSKGRRGQGGGGAGRLRGPRCFQNRDLHKIFIYPRCTTSWAKLTEKSGLFWRRNPVIQSCSDKWTWGGWVVKQRCKLVQCHLKSGKTLNLVQNQALGQTLSPFVTQNYCFDENKQNICTNRNGNLQDGWR